MRKNFFLFSIFIFCLTPALAKIDYEKLLLEGKFQEIEINFKKEKNLRKLFEDEALIYIHCLITDGKINESLEYIDIYQKRYAKNQDLQRLKSLAHLYLQKYDEPIFDANQKKHLDFLRGKIVLSTKEILDLENDFYLPNKYEYAISQVSNNDFSLIEKAILQEINEKNSILFPKSKDFFHLAFCYKALAMIKIYSNKLEEAKSFIKLAQNNIMRISSLWLVEDFKIYNPIMKTYTESTHFASIYPQYLISLREEFANYLN